jgi:FkbM family methyltransferase
MTNNFSDLKKSLSDGRVSKPEFISEAHSRFHSVLFEIASELPNTDIASIEITDNNVCMVSRLDNVRILVDSSDHRTAPIEILNFNAYEPELSGIIRSLAPFINTMLDIGANIGWYSLMVSKINKSAIINAFEPIPVTFQRLVANININKVPNVYAHPYGLSSQPGTFPFFFYPEGSGNASLKNLANRSDAQVLECTLRTLSGAVSDIVINQSIDFIKCDVEGNELSVVQGGLSVIVEHRPIILLELLRKWSARFGYHPNEVIDLLSNLGYASYVCTAGGSLVPIPQITETTSETNFFFVHPQSRLRDKLPFE